MQVSTLMDVSGKHHELPYGSRAARAGRRAVAGSGWHTFVFTVTVSRSNTTTVPALALFPVHTHSARPTTQRAWMGSGHTLRESSSSQLQGQQAGVG